MIQRFLKTVFAVATVATLCFLGLTVYQQEQEIRNLKANLVAPEIPSGLSQTQVESLIDQKINQIKFPVASSSTTTIIEKVPVSTPKTTPGPQEFVIPLGSGETSFTDQWVDIYSAQATIDTANYPKIKAAYFEAVMHIPNAQGQLSARLYETTLPFVYGDYLKTQSGTGELVSTPIFLQSGKRTYRVQLNNQIGTSVLDSARIRIVTE